MKTIEKVLSWASLSVIVLMLGTSSIYGGACVANYLHDLWHMSGWECLVLVPVVVLVGLAICGFFMLGLKQICVNYND